MTTANTFEHDVCIIGGGIVGTVFAAALAAAPKSIRPSVCLLEAGDLFRPVDLQPNVFSNRVSSITPSSTEFLRGLKVWDSIPASRRFPFSHMKVFDAVGGGSLHFDSEFTTSPSAIASIVENHVLQHTIASAISTSESIRILNQVRVASINPPDPSTVKDPAPRADWPTVHLADGTVIRARLIVGADGLNSVVRSFAGIESVGWDYGQNGVVATMEIDPRAENNTAWQRFLPMGPIAMLPLGNGYSSLVWTLPANLAQRVVQLPPADIPHLLNAAFRNPHQDISFLLSHISPTGAPEVSIADESAWGTTRSNPDPSIIPPTVLSAASLASFPLRLRNSTRYISHRVALIGDAAHTMHPLAGQGLNAGLGDAQALARILVDAAAVGRDIGDIHVLEEYADERYGKALGMVGAVDFVGRVFRGSWEPWSYARSWGMKVINEAPGLKKFFINFASG
ncbi:hypothetical protein BJ742DRAFT_683603 [Cladochytrium replicatum]|nr:hypothetical protein BJ742DRAFT_683603 [Cladochytrium replicatum]